MIAVCCLSLTHFNFLYYCTQIENCLPKIKKFGCHFYFIIMSRYHDDDDDEIGGDIVEQQKELSFDDENCRY